jgi:hypothetical protein
MLAVAVQSRSAAHFGMIQIPPIALRIGTAAILITKMAAIVLVAAQLRCVGPKLQPT